MKKYCKLEKLFSMLKLIKTGLIFLMIGLLASCAKDPKRPGYIYTPDMTYSRAYETYAPNPYGDYGSSAMKPPANTIPRGYKPFHYENNISDYARAGEELVNPVEATKENIAEGKNFYEIYCAICHGTKLDGNGRIVNLEKFPPPPSFFSDYMMNLPDGKKFFSIHYGKNLMGSYASQLTQEERWKVILYIDNMQAEKK